MPAAPVSFPTINEIAAICNDRDHAGTIIGAGAPPILNRHRRQTCGHQQARFASAVREQRLRGEFR
jgi:hypothetical protein